MAKKIKLDSSSINFSNFDDEPKKKLELKRILKIIDKYDKGGIKKVIQLSNKSQTLKDIIRLSAMNVYISAMAGEYRGRHSVSKAYRDLQLKVTFSKERRRKEKAKEKITDKGLESQAIIKNKDIWMKEAINEGKANILATLMFSIKDLVGSLKFVLESLDRQGE